MLRAVRRIVRDPDAARDALQDALVRLWQRRDVVRGHPNPEALVLRVCLHAAIDAARRGRRRREASDEAFEMRGACGQEPADALEETERHGAVLAALARLPHRQAVAVVMRAVEDEPYAVIAQALGCAEITARIHVMRARARLGRLLAHLAPKTTGTTRTG